MCVAAYFMFLTILFKMALITFHLHNSWLFKLEHKRKGFQMRSFTFYLEGMCGKNFQGEKLKRLLPVTSSGEKLLLQS